MKSVVLLLSFIFFSASEVYSQDGITFHVEELSPPDKALYMLHSDEIYKNLILSDVDLSLYDVASKNIEFPFDIICSSEMPDSLVSYGYHSFFNGMYNAYADHRPFVLSPDMIWLLISQGFAQHVNANPEQLREYFVDFSGKKTLVVSGEVDLNSSAEEWEKIFPAFTKQVAENTGPELIDILTADFSTTTAVERIASEITIMEAMKPYFEYVYIKVVCGIPQITLMGTTEDWEKVLEKTRKLSKYDLEWWTDELEPLLKEFIRASKGNVNKRFWRNMFKYHSRKKYGAPTVIDGWIVKFFPYDSDGKRNNLRNLISPIGKDRLPEEIVKVDLLHIDIDSDGNSLKTPLELWAGFIGLEQNKETFALTPRIGWMIRKKDADKDLKESMVAHASFPGINIKVKEVPSALLKMDSIRYLSIDFIGNINIPEEMKTIKIDDLYLNGKITKQEIERIKNMFPESGLTINDKTIRESKKREIYRKPVPIEDPRYRIAADSILKTHMPED